MNLTMGDDCQIPGLKEIYQKYLPNKGIFVEVGAYDGILHTNTFPLLGAGWKGIYFEPISEHVSKLYANVGNYPVHIEPKAAGAQEGLSRMIKRGEWSTLRGDYNEIVSLHPVGSLVEFSEENIAVTKVNTVLDRLLIDEIDLAVIDAEGWEFEVLRGFDIDKYKPKMIIIELHEESEFWMSHQRVSVNTKMIKKLLVDMKGYHQIYKDDINSIFIRED